MNKTMRYISGGILILMLSVFTSMVMTACTAPLVEVQVTQRVNTQSSDDPVSIGSELQGSDRVKTNETSPDVKVSPNLDDIAEDVKLEVQPN